MGGSGFVGSGFGSEPIYQGYPIGPMAHKEFETEAELAKFADYDLRNDNDIAIGPVETEIGGFQVVISAVTQEGKEHFKEGPKSRKNEDALIVLADRENRTLTFAVMDGVSDVTKHPELDGEKGAHFASHFLCRRSRELLKNTEISLGEIMSQLNRELWAEMVKRAMAHGENPTSDGGQPLDPVRPDPSIIAKIGSFDREKASTLSASTGTFARVNFEKQVLEIGHVGDTVCLVEYDDGTVELLTLDTNLYHMHQEHDNGLVTVPLEQNKARLTASFDAKNNPEDGQYGTGIFNGSPNIDNYILNYEIPLASNDAPPKKVKSVLLGTDGLFRGSLSINNTANHRRIMDEVNKKGLAGFLADTREESRPSPDPEVKVELPDDAAGVFIKIG